MTHMLAKNQLNKTQSAHLTTPCCSWCKKKKKKKRKPKQKSLYVLAQQI